MHLKNIEIQGFKSFAKKITFEFPEGITGIVGPNGSGKSNVADAIRWVLGEQKIKQLRGSKMEDVIFAGTENRKPLGFASVAITLDNSDRKLNIGFDEITVSRRVFRSGESEYMINGSACRLRDIQELFYDTGIGKEGYSIIGQGQIDKILQGKPEERREIFDEAAGIVKYKRRKTIALKKLENERTNITRISDILKELGRQVGPLERQAETARRYIRLKDELKKYDINYFLIENGEIKEKIKSFEEKEAIARGDLENSKAEYEKTKEEYNKISDALAELDVQINEIKEKISRGQIIRQRMQGQIAVCEEQIKAINDADRTFGERYDEIKAQIKDKEEEREKQEKERVSNEALTEDCLKRKAEQEKKVLNIQNENEALRGEIESFKEKMMGLINAKGEINARIERLNTMLEQMDLRKNELKNRLEQFSTDKESQEEKVAALKSEYEDAKQIVKELSDEIEKKESESADADRELKKLTQSRDEARTKIVGDKAKLDSLKNITERYEGYGNSIREVMALKEKNHGILGVVADIIKADKQYETAIEIALGGNIQNIVTDTESTAKEAIEYLKKNRLGRATFLPLKAVKGRGELRNPEVLEENGVIGVASELIHVEEKYKGIASYLLGKVIVVDKIDNALVLARKYNYSLLLVTLEGEYLNKGGALTGGAFKNKSNLLSRRREIEELTESIWNAKNRLDNFEKEAKAIDERKQAIKKDLLQKRAELQEQRIYANTVEINLKQALDKQEEILGEFENFNRENESMEEKRGGIRTENTTLADELADNEEETEKLKEAAKETEERLKESVEREAAEALVLQNIRMENHSLTDNSSYLTNAIIKLDTEIEKAHLTLNNLVNSNKNNENRIKEKQEEIDNLNKTLNQSADDEEALQEKLKTIENLKDERGGSHKDFIDKREEFAKRIADLENEIVRIAGLKDGLEDKFAEKADYIWTEYELTYSSALPLRDETLDNEKQMKTHIEELKKEIRGLGSINVGAVDEYKEVKERFDFLNEQHSDLLKAEADLVKIIKDLDREMRRQFDTEFKRINEEFGKVFREMFGGGNGTIELEEDADILDAGITIIAQPPGKKLQNMMQLSGGEKALTAIAVLFAIQNLKPSPFCMLDEIEAALDDANIDRFANYLKKLSGGIQFIVITHRKGTMEAAHRLYGITMQEKGVSSLISVNLEDVDDEIA